MRVRNQIHNYTCIVKIFYTKIEKRLTLSLLPEYQRPIQLISHIWCCTFGAQLSALLMIYKKMQIWTIISSHTDTIRSVSALTAVRPVHLYVLACASSSLIVLLTISLSQLLSALASISLWMPLTEEAPLYFTSFRSNSNLI